MPERSIMFDLHRGRWSLEATDAANTYCRVHHATRVMAGGDRAELIQVGESEFIVIDFGDGAGGAAVSVVSTDPGDIGGAVVTPMMPDESEAVPVGYYP